MLESAIVANAYTDISGETAYYAVPWAGGFNGILYNADKLKEYGEVPVTTDELLAVMKEITAIAGGSGGGKPDSARGGGKVLEKVDDALAVVDEIVAKQIAK